MIIRKLKLHPFAGLTNSEIEFDENLSVICGPNEAGKSTSVRALHFALFVKTNLTPAKEKSIISRFLPVTGGDTLNITLEFTACNENYILKKSWGGRKNSELILPGGTVISDADKVQEKINQLLEYNEATYQSVLFTYQSQLASTFNNLKEKTEASNSLADLLRSAVMAQGGISAEKLMQLLGDKEDEYYKNWELKENRPVKGRDIDDPHKKNIGLILKTYYQLRNFEEELKKTQEYEKQVDITVNKISSAEEKLEKKQQFITSHKDALKDARQRKNLEMQCDKLKYQFETLNKIFSKWPKLENQIVGLKEEKNKIEADLQNITSELENASQRDSLKSIEEKYKNADIIVEKVHAIENKLKELKKITADDINLATKLEDQIKNNKIRIEAQKLKLNLHAKEIVQLQLKHGMAEAATISLQENSTKDFELSGNFDIETSGLKISVFSGNENITELNKQIETWNKEFKEHLSRFSVSNIHALQSLYNSYKEMEAELKQMNSNLETVLGDSTFEELKRQTQAAKNIPLARETNLLRGLKAGFDSEIKTKYEKIKELEAELNELNLNYTSHENLSATILEIKQLLKEAEKTLNSLLPLPSGFNSAEEFIDKFEKISEECKLLTEEFNNLRIHRAELDNDKPLYSTEELTAEIDIAQKDFDRMKREGLAILKIKSKADRLIRSTETETYLPLQQKISKYFEEITDQKYHEVLLEGTLPVRIENNNKGFELQQLSKGTMDALALATRLGMAEIYLEKKDGFLIIDDPLVDLDEKRQKSAARTIQNFSKNKQVIVFTCHSTHAKIMKEQFYSMVVA